MRSHRCPLPALACFLCRGGAPGAKLVADGGEPVTRENRLLSWASEMEAQLVSQRQDLRRAHMELAASREARVVVAAQPRAGGVLSCTATRHSKCAAASLMAPPPAAPAFLDSR